LFILHGKKDVGEVFLRFSSNGDDRMVQYWVRAIKARTSPLSSTVLWQKSIIQYLSCLSSSMSMSLIHFLAIVVLCSPLVCTAPSTTASPELTSSSTLLLPQESPEYGQLVLQQRNWLVFIKLFL
jgi:hypothetical protein